MFYPNGDMYKCFLFFVGSYPEGYFLSINTYWYGGMVDSVPDPHLKRPPGYGSAWRDADPDPGGKKAFKNSKVRILL